MSVRDLLLRRIAEHCRSHSLTEREFGYAAVQDGRLVERLRCGKATLKVIEKAESFLDGFAAFSPSLPGLTAPEDALIVALARENRTPGKLERETASKLRDKGILDEAGSLTAAGKAVGRDRLKAYGHAAPASAA